MTAGMLLTLPSGLVAGLYRARGLYGRAVWLQSWATLVGQVGQLVAIVDDRKPAGGYHRLCRDAGTDRDLSSGDRCAAPVSVSARRAAPGFRRAGSIGQFRKAVPFGIAGATELALLNLPVLLVSALVSDRVAVAQWGLTRVVAGLLRALCLQTTLPLAAELGHDHAVGATERLRNLYARGSVFVAVAGERRRLGAVAVLAGFFRALDPWRHPLRSARSRSTLLIGTSAVAPAILALSYANYSNRGDLLVRTKGLQLAVFLILSLLLIPPLGPLGAAVAIVASDLSIQFGLLTSRHHAADAAASAPAHSVSGGGDDRDDAVRVGLGNSDPVRRCPGQAWHASSPNARYGWSLWRLAASPLAIGRIRERLIAAIPR